MISGIPTLGEETCVPLDELAAHSCARQFAQCVPLVALVCVDSNLLNFVDRHHASSSQALDNGLRTHTLLHMLLDLLQDLASQDYNRGCSISNFGVLRSCDICKNSSCRVDNI